MSVPLYKRKNSPMEFVKMSRDLHIWALKKSSKLQNKYAKHFDQSICTNLAKVDMFVYYANSMNVNEKYEERTKCFDKALRLLRMVAQQYSVLVEAYPEQFSKVERSEKGKEFYKLSKLLNSIMASDKKRHKN